MISLCNRNFVACQEPIDDVSYNSSPIKDDADIILNVGKTRKYQSLKEAAEAAKKIALKNNQRLQILLDAGIYESNNPDLLNFAQGERIKILGATLSASYDIKEISLEKDVENGVTKIRRAEVILKNPIPQDKNQKWPIKDGMVAYVE